MYTSIVLSDLDETLLPSNGSISRTDIETLHRLGENNIARAIVTGRSLYTARKVLPDDFPIDYLVFSTGAGVMNWRTKELIKAEHLNKDEISTLSKYLIKKNAGHFIHHPIPNNHFCTFFRGTEECTDFENRVSIYINYSRESQAYTYEEATQYIIIKDKGFELLKQLEIDFPEFNFITTTTFTKESTLWAEVFPKRVSKGLTSSWLCKELDIKKTHTMSIGNDHNDLAMLEWAHEAFVVENAPQILKEKFSVVADTKNSGFTEAVNLWLRRNQNDNNCIS